MIFQGCRNECRRRLPRITDRKINERKPRIAPVTSPVLNDLEWIGAERCEDRIRVHASTVVLECLIDFRPVNASTYKLLYGGIGLTIVAIVVLTWAFAPSGVRPNYPAGLERVSPTNGETVLSQGLIEVDLEPNYELTLIVDGLEIPPDQINSVGGGTGIHLWGPGPGRAFSAWTPGEHEVTVTFFNPTGVGGGAFTWSFRTQ